MLFDVNLSYKIFLIEGSPTAIHNSISFDENLFLISSNLYIDKFLRFSIFSASSTKIISDHLLLV